MRSIWQQAHPKHSSPCRPMGLALMTALALSACGEMSAEIKQATTSGSSLKLCTENSVTTDPCLVDSAGVIVSNSFGSDITTWSNDSGSTTVSAPIPNGFYANHNVEFTDANLLATNIVNGVTVFGVTGIANGPYTLCTDNALNSSQCSTTTNRYVYSSEYGGRSDNCSSGANASACWTNATNRYVTSVSGNDVSGSNGSLSATIPDGYYTGKTCSMSDSNLLASNIKSGVSIFGTTGSFIGSFLTGSNASRDPGSASPLLTNASTSSQISNIAETTTYSGADLPSSGSLNYRDVPDQNTDDDGVLGLSCRYASRPQTSCGKTQNTITARIEDCAAKNPTTSTWDGAVKCNRGQGQWKLVVRESELEEVWQDQRTGLLWSSIDWNSNATGWCQASGNTQEAPISLVGVHGSASVGNGSIGSFSSGAAAVDDEIFVSFTSATTFNVTGSGPCISSGSITAGGLTTTPGSTVTWSSPGVCSFTITQGTTNFASGDRFNISSVSANKSCAPGAASGLQPTNPVSLCAELPSLNPGTLENWTTGTYLAAKGFLGKSSTPSVRWRLPTIEDYKLADINGIRFVMPDMGAAGFARYPEDGTGGAQEFVNGQLVSLDPELSATVFSSDRSEVWGFVADNGGVIPVPRTNASRFRCVGR